PLLLHRRRQQPSNAPKLEFPEPAMAAEILWKEALRPCERRATEGETGPLKRGFTHAQAIAYLGIKRKAFERHIRPRATPVRIGSCLIFERFDLDRAFDEYKAERNGRPGTKGGIEWADQGCPVSTGMGKAAGVSTRSSRTVPDFESALAAVRRLKVGS